MEAIRATFPGHYSVVKQANLGRVCKVQKCGILLSRYNHQDICAKHRDFSLNVRTVG